MPRILTDLDGTKFYYERVPGIGRRRVVIDECADDGTLQPGGIKKPKRGRPPIAGQVQRTFQVPLSYMRALHSAVKAGVEAPRAADTQANLSEALKWITDRLGPMVDPEYIPPISKRSFIYRVRAADGTETDCLSALEAATMYGVSEAGLKVMLSRGSGKCGRFTTHQGEPARVECERLEVADLGGDG